MREQYSSSEWIDVILAAGLSTRMRMVDVPKVILPVGEKPALVKEIEAGLEAGMHQLVVVGIHSDKVLATLHMFNLHPDIVFQKEPRGTGDAAKQAAAFLKKRGFKGNILIRPGDMANIRPSTLKALKRKFLQSGADMMVLVEDKESFPDFGRVIYRKDRTIHSIVEKWDILKLILLKEIGEELQKNAPYSLILKKIEGWFSRLKADEEKKRAVLGDIYPALRKGLPREEIRELLRQSQSVYIIEEWNEEKRVLGGEELEKIARKVNSGLYIFKFLPFEKSVHLLKDDNAQRQYYLTDLIAIFNQHGFTVKGVEIKDEREIKAFNTPDVWVEMNIDGKNMEEEEQKDKAGVIIRSHSGIRGLIKGGMTSLEAFKTVVAFFRRYLGGTIKPPGTFKLIMGKDPKSSGEILVKGAVAAIKYLEDKYGIRIEVLYLGTTSSPLLQWAVAYTQAQGGLNFTASHNPIEWNGIKLVTAFRKGSPPTLLVPSQMQKVVEELHILDRTWGPREIREIKARIKGTSIPPEEKSIRAAFYSDVLEKVKDLIDSLSGKKGEGEKIFGEVRKRGFKIVIDACCGEGARLPCEFLFHMGIPEENLVVINRGPIESSRRRLEPAPEFLLEMKEAIKKEGADLGFAIDPDQDRLVIMPLESEEHTLLLIGKFLLELQRDNPLKPINKIPVNLSTTSAWEEMALPFGVKIIRVPTGEVNVVQCMLREKALFGGEGNGGVILASVNYGRNSTVGMALILTYLAWRGKTLREIEEELPSYIIKKDKVSLDLTNTFLMKEVVKEAGNFYRERYSGEKRISKVEERDGYKVHFEDGSWVYIRPSNTEPSVRIIAEIKRGGENRKRSLIQANILVEEAKDILKISEFNQRGLHRKVLGLVTAGRTGVRLTPLWGNKDLYRDTGVKPAWPETPPQFDNSNRDRSSGAVIASREFKKLLRNFKGEYALICSGDPFPLPENLLKKIILDHISKGRRFTLISSFVQGPSSYGKIVRYPKTILGIVEHRDFLQFEPYWSKGLTEKVREGKLLAVELPEVNTNKYGFWAKYLFLEEKDYKKLRQDSLLTLYHPWRECLPGGKITLTKEEIERRRLKLKNTQTIIWDARSDRFLGIAEQEDIGSTPEERGQKNSLKIEGVEYPLSTDYIYHRIKEIYTGLMVVNKEILLRTVRDKDLPHQRSLVKPLVLKRDSLGRYNLSQIARELRREGEEPFVYPLREEN